MLSLLNHQSRTIAGGAILLAFFSVLSRAAGFVRNAILAHQFGASGILDAYFAAFRLPDFLYQVIFLGALSAGFIPLFVERSHKDENGAWELAQDVFRWMTLGIAILSIIFIIFAPWLVPLIVPGFSSEFLAMTIIFSRIMFLQPIFLAASGIAGSVLQAKNRFLSYAAAPLFYNLGIIFGILVLNPLIGLTGLAWGVVLGALLHFLIQLPPVRALGFKVSFHPRHFSYPKGEHREDLLRIAQLSLPRALSILITHAHLFIIVYFSSRLFTGSLTILSFVQDLVGFPVGVFVIPFATALFPVLSHLHAKDDLQGFSQTFFKTLRQALFILVPLTFFFLVFRRELVTITLGYGEFGSQNIALTAWILALLSPAFVAQLFIYLSSRAFFAQADTKTPLWASVFGFIANVILVFALMPKFGISGLALSFSFSLILQAVILFVTLAPHLSKEYLYLFGAMFFKVILAAFIAVLFGQIFIGLVLVRSLAPMWQAVVSLVAAGSIASAVFIILSLLFKVEESSWFILKINKFVGL